MFLLVRTAYSSSGVGQPIHVIGYHRDMFIVMPVPDAKGSELIGHIEDFLEIKKTQLKGAKADAVTSRKKVLGRRADGSQMICTVQGVDKHGDGLRQVHT